MIRVLSLVLAALLAACATTDEVPTSPTQTSEPSGVTLEAIEGAPESVTDLLAAAFNATAAGRGLRAAEAGAGYVFHGYFSVVGSTAGTLLIYVWDVESVAGSRVTRISGQISSTMTAADPWQVVEASMVVDAITNTFDDFEAWQAGTGA